jgi:hypothetical protein
MPGPEFQLPKKPIERKYLYVNCFLTFHSKVEDMFCSELFNQPVTCCQGSEEHQFNWNNPRKRMESGKNTVSVNFTNRLTSAAKQHRISFYTIQFRHIFHYDLHVQLVRGICLNHQVVRIS